MPSALSTFSNLRLTAVSRGAGATAAGTVAAAARSAATAAAAAASEMINVASRAVLPDSGAEATIDNLNQLLDAETPFDWVAEVPLVVCCRSADLSRARTRLYAQSNPLTIEVF